MEFTKDAGRKLIEMWEHHTTTEIAEALDTNRNTVYLWTSDMRKEGIELPKKTRENNTYKKLYMSELLEEQKAGKINSLPHE